MTHESALACCCMVALSLTGCASEVTPLPVADAHEIALQDGSVPDALPPPLDVAMPDTPEQGTPEAPRLRSPLSTATVTSQQPTLTWILASATDGARIELCRDRAMTVACIRFDATGTSSRPPAPLTTGMWFWRANGRRGTTLGQPMTPVWEFMVGARSAPVVDTSWGTVLDVNGDGYADVLVGAAGAMNYAGRMYLYLGSPTGLTTSPNITLTHPNSDDQYFGRSFASAGDVNGDGFPDIAAATPTMTSMQDRIYVYSGGATGLNAAPTWVIEVPPNTRASTGVMITSAGDLNGDGYADIAVGENETDDRAGRAYIYYGSPAGFASDPDVTLLGLDGHNAGFGHTVENVGDTDGDGFPEIAIGAPGPGRTYIFRGSPTGIVTMPAIALTGPSGSGSFSYPSNNASDLNGDGYADLLVGAPTSLNGVGSAYAYLGSAVGIVTASEAAIPNPDMTFGYFAQEMSMGDFNDDGYADVVVTAFGADNGVGSAFVYLGGPNGSLQTPSISLVGPDGANALFGGAITMPGDVNGDSFDDLAISAGYASNGTGRVYVYFGGPMGLSSVATTTLTGLDGPDGYFGALGR